jgi:plastocyanin
VLKILIRRTSLLLVLVALLGLTAAACGDDDDDDPGDDPTATTAAAETPDDGGEEPVDAAVAVADNSFTPASLTVPVGTTVTWTWGGSNPHTVTASDGSFESEQQNAGTFEQTFDTAGTFDYFCAVHGESVMSGTIVVE